MKLNDRLARIGRRRTVHGLDWTSGPDWAAGFRAGMTMAAERAERLAGTDERALIAHGNDAFADAVARETALAQPAPGGLWVRPIWDADLIQVDGLPTMRLTVQVLDPDDRAPVKLTPIWPAGAARGRYPQMSVMERPCPPGWTCKIDVSPAFYADHRADVAHRAALLIPSALWRLAEWDD